MHAIPTRLPGRSARPRSAQDRCSSRRTRPAQAFPIEHLQIAPVVGNDTAVLQHRCRSGHAYATHAQQVAQGLLRHPNTIASPVLAHQQPAGELRPDIVLAQAMRQIGELVEVIAA